MAGYVKVFPSILDSTVWQTPGHVRLVWITMLVMADRDGVVEASVPGLAARAGVDRAHCEQALALFLAPDPDSRSPEHEGRRIEKVEGGWRLLSYERYREKSSLEEVREKAAARQRRYRERVIKRNALREATAGDGSNDIASASPSASASPHADLRDHDRWGSPDQVTRAPAPLVGLVTAHKPATMGGVREALESAYATAYAQRWGSTWSYSEPTDGMHVHAVATWCLTQPQPETAAREVIAGAYATPRLVTGRRAPWPWIAEKPDVYAATGREALARSRIEPEMSPAATAGLVAALRASGSKGAT